jgi:hypothetical protein
MFTQDFLTLYNENSQRITGVPYFIICKEGELLFEEIYKRLENEEKEILIDVKEKFPDENVYVPDIFLKDGKLRLKNKIEKIELGSNSLFFILSADYLQKHYYRGGTYLIIRTNMFSFELLYNKKVSKYFVILYCARYRSLVIRQILNDLLLKVGLRIAPSFLKPKKLKEIKDSLKGKLLIANLEDYPYIDLNRKVYIGNGFDNRKEFVTDTEIGKVSGQMFHFMMDGDEKDNVVTLANDGLVRFYNNVSYDYFKRFMQNYILEHLSISKIIPTALDNYILDSIFYENNDLDDPL